MAAQHLLDGFPMEMQDGDSGHLHTKWLTAVFDALTRKIGDTKIFVLSAIGIQSAGKSTLLNTMFGTSFKCGDGMCTKGINIQLIPSNYSKAGFGKIFFEQLSNLIYTFNLLTLKN